MADETRRHAITLKRVVYEIPGTEALRIRRDVAYAAVDGEELSMDLYYPANTPSSERAPAVVFVIGYPDGGFRKIVGCAAKEMALYISWAQLAAASGLVGITYTNRDPADVHTMLGVLRDRANELGIDGERIALWACSGNGPTAASMLMDRDARVRCAAFCYAYLLDGDGETLVADAARTFKFSNPCAGRPIADLASEIPLLIVRAGLDEMPGLNASTDRFVRNALERNLPLSLVNHPAGPHAFDLVDTSAEATRIIKQVLTFLQQHT